MRHSKAQTPRSARGVALVIALLLMVVLSLLAIGGMNSAAVEFIMAGNDQFHENAFQASETGIQAAIATGTYLPGSTVPFVVGGSVPNSTTDTYAANIVSQLNGYSLPAPDGFSISNQAAATYPFEIRSAGNSLRGSTALHNQGVAVVGPGTPTYPPLNPLTPGLN